ncbi:dynein intermediate chain 2, ciliary-like [Argonauta hians]
MNRRMTMKERKSMKYDAGGGPGNLFNRKSAKPCIRLNHTELNLEYTLLLTPTVKVDYENLVRFDYALCKYIPIIINDQVITLELLRGNLYHREERDESTEWEEGTDSKLNVEKKLFNAFNFGDRGSQTIIVKPRDKNTMTDPPPTKNFSDQVNQWVIYDAYEEDCMKDNKDDTNKKKTVGVATSTELDLLTVNIMDRLVNQNIYNVLSQDYRYYEDEADDLHVSYGSLLPLWEFSHRKTLGLSVTAVCWNPRYSDFFACGFGSYSMFQQQYGGLIMLYTLKNPSCPKYMFDTKSSVMTLDIHEEFPYYICVGLYDGNVAVYNLLLSSKALIHKSNSSSGKHHYEVTQVKWQPSTEKRTLTFCSISSSGTVLLWTVCKTALNQVRLLALENSPLKHWYEGVPILPFGCASSISFHRKIKHIYLLATQTGKVHLCSKRINKEVINTIDAHSMGVNKVEWNAYHPDVFITCSNDWSVKIWEQPKKQQQGKEDVETGEEQSIKPVFTYDLESKVTDVAWAPYSSSVFAASTSKGYVYVYDLNINRYEPMCRQVVVRKKETEVTKIVFNTHNYSILVGDTRGDVTCLKLSSNLRKQPKTRKGERPLHDEEKLVGESNKLKRIFDMAR